MAGNIKVVDSLVQLWRGQEYSAILVDNEIRMRRAHVSHSSVFHQVRIGAPYLQNRSEQGVIGEDGLDVRYLIQHWPVVIDV